MKPAAAVWPEPSPGGAPPFFSPHVAHARRFYLDLNPARKAGLVVVCGGVEQSTPEYGIHRDTFPFYSIEYVVGGKGQAALQGRSQSLQPGRAFSYGPGIRQDIGGDPALPLTKYFVDFTGTRARALLRSCGLMPGSFCQVFPSTALQPLFDELVCCGLRGTGQSGALCVRLLECLALRIAESRAPLEGAETLAFRTYQQCRQHIQQHFQRLRTLAQIGSECHVNDAYLCRLFRRYDHQSPYQYLLRLKMNRAADLLRQPGALVKQVAREVGYDDPFHFSRTFKRLLGVAPEQLRRLR